MSAAQHKFARGEYAIDLPIP